MNRMQNGTSQNLFACYVQTERIVSLRKRFGLTIEDMANLMGISRITYRKLECGRREPKISDMALMADIFGVAVTRLFNLKPKKQSGCHTGQRGKG